MAIATRMSDGPKAPSNEVGMYHTPVMVDEVLSFLLERRPEVILDATLGTAGHTLAILQANDEVRVIGIEWDDDALRVAEERLAPYRARVELMKGNFANAAERIRGRGKVDGVLLDLGVSSLQLDRADRGFSYMKEGPLDMRMSQEGRTVRSLIDVSSEKELTRVLKEYGEMAGAARIARAIGAAADRGGMNTTFDLRGAVETALGSGSTPGVLSKVFQALRIALNGELANLESFLRDIPRRINSNRPLVAISYHSLEDRIVKNFFKRESTACICPPGLPVCACGHEASMEMLTRRAVRPSDDEITRNPRSRSARLRVVKIIR